MDDQHSEFKELASDAVELLVNLGLINSISGRWPVEVQERWHERLEEHRVWVNRMISEAQEFASLYD